MSETFLIMTIFRDEFNSKYILMFTGQFLVKVFHWVAADRIDYMDQTPTLSGLFHLRISVLLVLLEAISVFAVQGIVLDFFKTGPSMMILFGFEFSILAVTAFGLISKYVIYWIVTSNPPLTENKSMYIFYLELLTGI